MALKLLQPHVQPYGQFDGYDDQVTEFLGGEVCTLVSVLVDTDVAAADVEGGDGYVGVAHQLRPVVSHNLTSGDRPLFLADDGVSGYGTLFGSLIGGNVGQDTAGTVIGPHSAVGSGKITLWNGPGLYAVTLDAVDTTAATGLVPTNSTLDVGDALYATSAGKLTPNSSNRFENVTVGRFVEFSTNGSLVTTPNYLTAALNSPTGSVGVQVAFTQAVFHFAPPIA